MSANEALCSDDGVVGIEMTNTTCGCPATGSLRQVAEGPHGIWAGIEFVDVRLAREPPWGPAMV